MIFKETAYYYLIGFFCLLGSMGFAQDQKLADSLKMLYKTGNYIENELVILNEIAINEPDPKTKLEYSELLINKAAKDSLLPDILNGYLQKGHSLRDLGNNTKALQSYFTGLKMANQLGDQKSIGTLMVAIADTYSIMDNHKNAETYYLKSLKILREVNDSIQLASVLLNAGDEFFNNGKYDKALEFFQESGNIFKAIDHQLGIAYNLGNVGMVHAEQGKDKLAEEKINEAILILEKLGDYYPISVYLTYMSDIYERKNDMESAFKYSERSLEIAKNYELKEQISAANLQLSTLYKQRQDFENAYKHYAEYIIYRDSINNLEAVQEMARIRTDYEISQKQAEVDLMSQQRRTQKVIVIATAIALFLIGLLAIGLYRRNKFISKTKAIIEREKNRSDRLLLNILPEETAQELKEAGKVKSKRFDSVTVLFADFKDFTRYSENLTPEQLVENVDFYFSSFDEIMEKYDLEKIKTIGDCYMCAGGLPFPTEDHAHKILMAAFDIIDFVHHAKPQNTQNVKFDVRIGVNTGSVVAGVVGSKKFAYDIWGDTVNIASRMESNSGVGKVNISENTYNLVRKDFICEYRGKIEVKNKGMMKMYYANAIKPDSKVPINLKQAKKTIRNIA